MALRTADQYLAGLRDGRTVYYKGERVADVTTHPELGRAARHCAVDYAVTDDAHHRALAVTEDDDGVHINRFYKLPRTADDLLQRREMIAETTRAGRGLIVLVREIGTDYHSEAHIVTKAMEERLKTPYHERLRAYWKRVAHGDLAMGLAQTDVKGDRALGPAEQEHPDYYVRIVDRQRDGIVVRGAKAHTTNPVFADELIVLPCRALGEGNLAQVALIVTGEALRTKELASMGLRPDSWRPGLFVEVIDAGPFPHCREDRFARRLGDENGQLSHDCLVLRISVLDRSFSKSEMEAFEYDAEDLSSVTTDYSLQEIADGTLGDLPGEILTAILTNGENDALDLTDRAFWLKHPDLKGKTLDQKDPKQKKLRDEWGLISRRGVKPIIWLRQVIDELDQHRGDIPREFLLGWMATESDGQVSTVSSLGERGYFQIMWQSGEAKSQLGLTEREFQRLSTDREFSIAKGVQLAETYRQYFLRKYPSVPDGSDLLWRLTKGRHALPTALDKALDGLVKAGTGITWQAVSRSLPKLARGVDRTLD